MRNFLALMAMWTLAGEAAADPAGIRLQPTDEGVRVEYRLTAPATRFTFETPMSREAWITPAEPGVTFAPDTVTMAQPLSAFSLIVRPDRVRVDAVYPVLTRLGDGWMIHLPSFRGQGESGEVTIETPPGWAVTAGPGTQPMDGFVYIGPAHPDAAHATRTIIDPVLPGWLSHDATAALESSNAFYAHGLAMEPPGQPVLLMGSLPAEDRSTFIGDVTPNGVVNLQFAPDQLPPDREPRISDMIVPFVAHETFHVWQGDGFHDAGGVNGRWLTEGSAEYFSLLAQAATSRPAAAHSREVLARRLGACLSAMDSRPQGLLRLDEAAAQATRYDCGTVSQWLADLQTREDGGLFAVWRDLLGRADGYGVADFRAVLARRPSSGDAGQTVLLDGGPDIRGGVLAALTSLGSGVEPADPGRSAWAGAALWPLLESSCSGQLGIRTEDGRFFLDTGDRCGPLSGDHEAVSIDGHRFDVSGEAAFRAVEAACAGQGAVSVGLVDGGAVREVRVTCDRPSKAPAPAYRIADLL